MRFVGGWFRFMHCNVEWNQWWENFPHLFRVKYWTIHFPQVRPNTKFAKGHVSQQGKLNRFSSYLVSILNISLKTNRPLLYSSCPSEVHIPVWTFLVASKDFSRVGENLKGRPGEQRLFLLRRQAAWLNPSIQRIADTCISFCFAFNACRANQSQIPIESFPHSSEHVSCENASTPPILCDQTQDLRSLSLNP